LLFTIHNPSKSYPIHHLPSITPPIPSAYTHITQPVIPSNPSHSHSQPSLHSLYLSPAEPESHPHLPPPPAQKPERTETQDQNPHVNPTRSPTSVIAFARTFHYRFHCTDTNIHQASPELPIITLTFDPIRRTIDIPILLHHSIIAPNDHDCHAPFHHRNPTSKQRNQRIKRKTSPAAGWSFEQRNDFTPTMLQW